MHLTECYETAHHLELEDAARVGFPPVASLEIGLAPLGREGPGELRCRRRVLTEAPHQGREVVADASDAAMRALLAKSLCLSLESSVPDLEEWRRGRLHRRGRESREPLCVPLG